MLTQPGAVELPQVTNRLYKTGCCDAVSTGGTPIRVTSLRIDHISSEAAHSIQRIALQNLVPVTFVKQISLRSEYRENGRECVD